MSSSPEREPRTVSGSSGSGDGGPGTVRGDRLVFEVMNAERALRRWIDARSGDSGIGAAGAGVLFHLAGHDNALVGDVSAALRASPSGISGLVSRLEKGGFVTKSPDTADARAVRLRLTPLGRDAVATAKEVVRELNVELSDGFTAGELGTVARWLGQITQRLT